MSVNIINMIILKTNFYIVLLTTIALVCCKSVVKENESALEESQLIFAQIIFRHGERNIYPDFPYAPYDQESYWPGGFQALTNVGKQQQYELGRYFSSRYKQLIGEHYSPNKVYYRSSDLDRALMSAQCNAAGLFPPNNNETWNKELAWQPIPIHTVKFDEDNILNDKVYCPRHDHLMKLFVDSSEFEYQREKHEKFFEYLEKYAKKSFLTHLNMAFFLVAIQELKERQLELPEWVDNISHYTNNTLEHIISVCLETRTHSAEMKKLRAGFLIKEIFDRFKNKSLSMLQPDRSLWIYSAHDTTIMKVLSALNMYELHMPVYASSLLFELHLQSGKHFVKLFYRNTTAEEVPALEIPYCGVLCPLEKLYELYEDILPTDNEDFDSLCQI